MIENPQQLAMWSEEYGDDVILLADSNEVVWEQYRADMYKPQYIVIDRDLTVAYKGVGPEGGQLSENAVLELLNE